MKVWATVEMNHANGSPLRLRITLGLALIFVTGSMRAQGIPAGNGPSSLQRQTTLEFNQRLDEPRNTFSSGLPEPSTDESRIGPDDLLDITVFEAPEMDHSLRVSANGEISLQLLGPVKAGGLTPRQLESVLQELLRRTYMKNPHVGVFVRELQSHPVSVIGAVKRPGVFQIRGTKTVLELLSMAEGLADDAGDTLLVMRGAGFPGSSANVGMVREPQKDEQASVGTSDEASASEPDALTKQNRQDEIVEVNLKSLLESVDPAINIPVHPGDIVKVARAGIVYVIGEVRKPGGFVLKSNENISVLQALALAEGVTRTASKSQVRIIRTDQNTGKHIEIPIDLGKMLSSKAPDPLLQPKDIIFVPDSSARSAFYRGAEAVLSTATGVVIYRR